MKKSAISLGISSLLLTSIITGCSNSDTPVTKIKLKTTEFAVASNETNSSLENEVIYLSEEESTSELVTITGSVISASDEVENIIETSKSQGKIIETNTTVIPTIVSTTNVAPTTDIQVTTVPTTEAPTTTVPTTEVPTTEVARTEVPKTEIPTTEVATTQPTDNKKQEPIPNSNINSESGDIRRGKATFYGAGPGGCCNLDDYEDKYYTVAMNRPDYNKYNLAGAYLEVTDKDGDKVNVLVTNELPEGNSGDLDLSTSAFESIEPLVTGIMNVSWKIVPLPTNEPIYYKYKPDSSQWWLEVQIRNQRYPIKTVEYKDENGNWIALERKHYNYYCASRGIGHDGPYTFRVTDMYGHVLIDENIPLNRDQQCIPGGGNFPY